MSWDVHSKLLLKECPQDFVTYFVPGAHYVRMRETQLQTREDGTFEPREMRGDIMIEAENDGENFLIDVEWQSTRDDNMDERLLGYSYEATRLHKLHVLSCVIYTKPVSKISQPPMERDLPFGFRSIWFNYKSVEIAEKQVEEFRQCNLDGLKPLMPLCKNGATYEVLEEVLTYLVNRKKGNLVSLTRFFAGMVFTSDKDKVWLKRRFEMLDEFLWQNSWTYRETVEKSMEQGLAQGRVQEAQQNIESLVEKRFPASLAWVKAQVEQITDLATLREILSTLFTASTEEDVRRSLPALR